MLKVVSPPEPRLEETKRVSRVLRIVQLVSAQPRVWTRGRLAGKFEVSERTIDKDLQLVRHGLRFDLRRSAGGYHFAGDPATKTVHLSLSEALALALAAQQARDTATVDSGTIAGALARIEDALPASVVPYLRRADGGSSMSPFRPARGRDGVLSILEQSRVEGRKVSMEYASASHGGAVTERTVAPYYLLPYERSWMLFARDDLRDAASPSILTSTRVQPVSATTAALYSRPALLQEPKEMQPNGMGHRRRDSVRDLERLLAPRPAEDVTIGKSL